VVAAAVDCSHHHCCSAYDALVKRRAEQESPLANAVAHLFQNSTLELAALEFFSSFSIGLTFDCQYLSCVPPDSFAGKEW
jgi:hypothetical protein